MATDYESLTPAEVLALSMAMGTTGFNALQKRVLMRLADAITAYPTQQRILDANLTGVPGPEGPAGPAGATGAQGPAGPTGPAGPQGPAGADGTGVTIKGSVSTVGALPPSGNEIGDAYIVTGTGDLHVWDGSAWTNAGPIVGPEGPVGPAGPTGPAGATGPAGPTGATGAAGATGATGPAGADGATGPQGPAGPQGLTGATGATGPQGPAGPAGDAGPQGAVGPTGPAGAQGIQGPPGTVWRDGAGAPADSLGVNGDYYLDEVTGDVYVKASGTYSLTANIRGPQGPQGIPGSGGGGGGIYQIGGGGGGSNLAPALSAFTMSGATPPVYSGGSIVFTGASNLAAAIGSVNTVNNETYDVSITVSGYTSGSLRVILYGDVAPYIDTGPTITANGTYNFQLTPVSSTGSQNNQVRIQATGASGTNTYNITACTVAVAGGGGVARDMTEKVSEIEVSVLDFGADPTGTTASDAAFAAAIAYSRRIHIPEGTYRLNDTLNINRSVYMYGDGRDATVINSYVSGAKHGMVCIGEDAFGRRNLMILEGFKFNGAATLTTAGTGPGAGNWSGIYIQRKVLFRNIWVDSWTNDGIYFAPRDEHQTGVLGTRDEAVFFCRMDNVWSKNNGRDGIWVRRGANANSFINCQFDNNGRYGFHHSTDNGGDGTWGGCYGSTIRDGQASYNDSYGYYFENGTNLVTSGLYGELNGWNGVDGYINTPYDFYVGDNLVRSWIGIGVLYNASTSHVRLPGFNSNTIQVWEGGRRLFGDT